MAIDYTQRIPNNVDLSSDRRLQRALENWQPRFLDWWKDMGPDGTLNFDVYLRTAISAEANGWANFGYVKMPDYRWGIFLAGQDPNRVIAYGDNKGKPVWQEVPGRAALDPAPPDRDPGRHRARLGRAAAPARQDRALALRPAQPLPDQLRGRPPSVGHGLPAARLFRPRRPRGGGDAAGAPFGRSRQAAHPRRLQREDAGLALLLHVHLLHRPRRQVPARLARRIGLRSAGALLPLHADRGSAPHVRGRIGRAAHRPAHLRADEGAQDRRRAQPGRDRPGDDPEVPQLPLLGVARPVRPGGLHQRRQLLHDGREGPLPRDAHRRRPSADRRRPSTSTPPRTAASCARPCRRCRR